MRTLMLGWEFPPHHNGGLGVACQGIVEGLNEHGVFVHLVLPDAGSTGAADYVAGSHLRITRLPANLVPYQGAASRRAPYAGNLFDEVERYAQQATALAKNNQHDVVHAHDWMTYPAAERARRHSGKPFIAHVHALEHDRTGDSPHPIVAEIEANGLRASDKIIAVSELTKRRIVKYYDIDPDKVVVVHNAVTRKFRNEQVRNLGEGRKYVLFLGRITLQKGPEYFLRAADKVLSVEPEVNFLMAGEGDMLPEALRMSILLGISSRVFFSGFLRGADIDRAFATASVFVMPSVSEPFGIAALEAVAHGVPVIVSRGAGVSEVIRNMLRVDFWDIDEMANKIVMALQHQPLRNTLVSHASRELDHLTWNRQGEKVREVYGAVSGG